MIGMVAVLGGVVLAVVIDQIHAWVLARRDRTVL